MTRILSKLSIKNFRQYHDVSFDFGEGLNVVFGGNRYGKTNVLNAILWCMYGGDALSIEKKSNEKHFIKNERFMKEDTEVSLLFHEGKLNKKERIVRRESEEPVFLVKQGISGAFKPKDPDIFKILPDSLKDFFLFKGEFLNNFFEERNIKSLKEIILSVSKLNDFKELSNFLGDMETKYQNELNKQNTHDRELSKSSTKAQQYSDAIKKIDGEVETKNLEVIGLKHKRDSLMKDLFGFGTERLLKLLRSEKKIELLMSNLENDQKNLRGNALEHFLGDLSKYYLLENFNNFRNHLSELDKNGLMPPPMPNSIIMKIKEDGVCICGSHLDSKKLKRLERYATDKTKIHEDLKNLYKVYVNMNLDSTQFRNSVKIFRNSLDEDSEIISKLQKLRDNLDDLRTQLKGINKKEVTRKIAEREALDSKIETIQSEITKFSVRRKEFEYYYKKFRDDYQRSASKLKSRSSKGLLNKLKKCSDLKFEILKMYDQILERMLKDINSKTQNNFRDMFWENYKYIDYEIKITKEFEFEVKSPEGNNMLFLLSTGEKKILALAFITALSDFYGFDFPIVMDAPFTELQGELTSRVLKSIMKISSKRQIIVLAFPPQDKKLENALANSAKHIYNLEKKSDDDTRVKKVL